MISAKVIADSMGPDGQRVTTMELEYPRFIHAQVMTHRVFSRNGASSRAIPVERMLERVETDPVRPVAWPREQRGMQGGEELDGLDRLDAEGLWTDTHRATTKLIRHYLADHPDKATRLHKSVVNRLLEPFVWMRLIVTATDWDGFWRQRAGNGEGYTDAQAEIHMLADRMLRDAYLASAPRRVGYHHWHLPYVTGDSETLDAIKDRFWRDAGERAIGAKIVQMAKRISVARCARVSYLTHDGRRDIEADLKLADRLASADPPHASPFEHVCTPAKPPRRIVTDGVAYVAEDDLTPGNLDGWRQYRHDLFPTL